MAPLDGYNGLSCQFSARGTTPLETVQILTVAQIPVSSVSAMVRDTDTETLLPSNRLCRSLYVTPTVTPAAPSPEMANGLPVRAWQDAVRSGSKAFKAPDARMISAATVGDAAISQHAKSQDREAIGRYCPQSRSGRDRQSNASFCSSSAVRVRSFGGNGDSA